jgi:hypothetical protein
MARWYKIMVGGTTFDATGDPNALQVELDITVAQFAVPHPGQAAWCRVWGIPLQTVLTANQFTNQQIQVFGGMSAGLPLANPNEQGLLVQGVVLPALGNWTGTNMYVDFYITPGTLGNPTVPGAANIVHNQPAQHRRRLRTRFRRHSQASQRTCRLARISSGQTTSTASINRLVSTRRSCSTPATTS